jgi:hypothetical protein
MIDVVAQRCAKDRADQPASFEREMFLLSSLAMRWSCLGLQPLSNGLSQAAL